VASPEEYKRSGDIAVTPGRSQEMHQHPGDDMGYRQPGQQIEVRFLLVNQPFLVVPVTVVTDGPDLISHYLADGTHYLRREAMDGSPPPRVIPPEEIGTVATRMVEDTWRGSHRLVVTRPGQAHAVFLKWNAAWEFREWYVNLQEPLRRTGGFDTRDNFLDIQVSPDRSWRWKDEDELELAVELGRRTREQAEAIQREAESIIPDIEAGSFPFDDSLIDWRPEPEWPIPRLSLDDR
jgi:uncharacterized protein